MILPTKHVPTEQTLLGVGAVLLGQLVEPRTLSDLWERARMDRSVGTYERFVVALDLLYILKLVSIRDGMLVKAER